MGLCPSLLQFLDTHQGSGLCVSVKRTAVARGALPVGWCGAVTPGGLSTCGGVAAFSGGLARTPCGWACCARWLAGVRRAVWQAWHLAGELRAGAFPAVLGE